MDMAYLFMCGSLSAFITVAIHLFWTGEDQKRKPDMRFRQMGDDLLDVRRTIKESEEHNLRLYMTQSTINKGLAESNQVTAANYANLVKMNEVFAQQIRKLESGIATRARTVNVYHHESLSPLPPPSPYKSRKKRVEA
jgi:hypothetical protein